MKEGSMGEGAKFKVYSITREVQVSTGCVHFIELSAPNPYCRNKQTAKKVRICYEIVHHDINGSLSIDISHDLSNFLPSNLRVLVRYTLGLITTYDSL